MSIRAFSWTLADGLGAPLPRMSCVACARVATGVMPGEQSDEPYAGDQRGSGPTAERDNGFAGAHLLDDQHRWIALQRHHQVQSEGHGPAVQRNEYVHRLGAEQAGVSGRLVCVFLYIKVSRKKIASRYGTARVRARKIEIFVSRMVTPCHDTPIRARKKWPAACW